MSVATMLLLLLLALHSGLKQDHQIDVATAKEMLEREVYLRQTVIRLLHEIEGRTEETTLLSTLRWQWLFCIAAVALVPLTVVWWRARHRKLQESPQTFTASCSGLPPDVSEVEIKLLLCDQDDSGS